jgi:hypothetical protein
LSLKLNDKMKMTTTNDIPKAIKGIDFVDLRFTDLKDKLQHVTLDGSLVDESVFLEGVILIDPSYAGEIITLTFTHIGNVGTNDEDVGSRPPTNRGLMLRVDIARAANWRAPAICVQNSSKAHILRPAQPRSAEPAR